MKTSFWLICSMLFGLLLGSCSDDLQQNAPDRLPGRLVLKATQNTPSTRATLEQDGLTVNWEPGDKLVLVDKSRTLAPIYLSCTLEAPASSATFVSESGVPAGNYWVIYNYNENLVYTHQGFSSVDDINAQDKLVLYGEITVTAQTETASVEMKHLYAMINIQLKNIPGYDANSYFDGNYEVGMYSSKKGLAEYKMFSQNGIVNAYYENYNGNTRYVASDRKRHNIRLGSYYVQNYNNDDGTAYTNNLAQLEANSALVLPEDLSGEDVYFYVVSRSHDNNSNPVCYEIKKPIGKVKLEAGIRYKVILDMSDSDVNTQVSTLPLVSVASGMDYIYGVSTDVDLRHLAYGPKDAYGFKLMDDIDLAGKDFFPIERGLDGDGKTISNLTLERPDEDNVGFTTGYYVNNLTLANATIKGKNYVGAFAGYGNVGRNCKLTGTSQVIGTGDYVGGIVGKHDGLNCSFSDLSVGSTCTVSGTNYVGGIVGAVSNYYDSNYELFTSSVKSFDSCIFSGTVIATGDYVGGIFGKLGGGRDYATTRIEFSMDDYTYSLIKCQNKGTVTGRNYVGGIGGDFALVSANSGVDRVVLKQTCSNGNVSGENFVGGILGSSYSSVNTCYSTGEISGSSKVGGIVGVSTYAGGSMVRVANCYSLSTITCDATSGIAGGIFGFGGDAMGGINITNSYFAGNVTTGQGILGESGGYCSIDHCLTTLSSFCSNWGNHMINQGENMYQNYPDTAIDPANVLTGVTSILDNREIINGDNAYSTNVWANYPNDCIKFSSFSADTDAPDFDEDVIN